MKKIRLKIIALSCTLSLLSGSTVFAKTSIMENNVFDITNPSIQTMSSDNNEAAPNNKIEYTEIFKDEDNNVRATTIPYEESITNYQNSIREACEKNDIVYLGEGTYYIEDINFIYGNTTVIGLSRDKTIIKRLERTKDNVETNQISNKDTEISPVFVKGSEFNNITFQNITFDDFVQFGFYNTENIKFEHCNINNFRDIALNFECVNHVVVDDCGFYNSGWNMKNDSFETEKNIVHTSHGYSIRCTDWHSLDTDVRYTDYVITNNIFDNSKGNSAISFVGKVDGYTIDGNTFQNTAWGGFAHWENRGMMVNQCYIRNNKFYNIGMGEPAESDKENYAASGVGANAIFTKGHTNAIVENNYIENVVENGIEGMYPIIRNNTIYHTGVIFPDLPKRKTQSVEGIFLTLNNGLHDVYVENNYIYSSRFCITTDATNNSNPISYASLYIRDNTLITDKNINEDNVPDNQL